MAKIYNEIIIDMNPESPTFEETLHEDSFEYEGDMILAMPNGEHAGGYNIDIDFSGMDLFPGLFTQAQYDTATDKLPGETYEEWRDRKEQERIATIQKYPTSSIEELGWGAKDISPQEMLNMTSTQMLQWIKDTRYGGVWPDNIDPVKNPEEYNEFVKTVMKNMPKKGEIEGTDWYGLQETAGKIGEVGRSAYGGMGAGGRQAITGQKQLGKSIYGLEEKKGKEWETKFGSFLSTLPPATGG
tara:strand:+ start:314 stop:1039 length:726 start_codon:yes stop_codon:yes gene_type:complete